MVVLTLGGDGLTQRIWSRIQAPKVLLTGLAILIAVYFVFPVYWLFVASTKSNAELFQYVGAWIPPHLELWRNVVQVFQYNGGEYARWLANSFEYAISGAFFGTIFSALAGYAFSKHGEGKAMRMLFWVLVGSIFVPVTALALPIFIIMGKFGLINSPLAVILPSMVSPFGLYLMRIYSDQGVPNEVLESARLDGASEWAVFVKVARHFLAVPASAVFLFSFVANWNNFFLPLIVLNSSNKFPVNLGLTVWNGLNTEGHAKLVYNLVLTGASISVIPLIIGFFVLQRYWRMGAAAGSVTGV